MATKTLVLLALLAPAMAGAVPTRITFEELPNGTVVRNQYGSRGVFFRDAVVVARDAVAHSRDRVLFAVRPGEEIFQAVPLVIDFASGQRYVKLFAGIDGSTPATATLTAFDASGRTVVKDGPRTVPPGAVNTVMQVQAPAAVIRRVELAYVNSAWEMIDDLEFDGDAPPAVPTGPPSVAITSPANGQPLTGTSVTVKGRVDGPQISPQATLRTTVRRPPGSTVTATFNYPVTLAGTGDHRTFTQSVTLGVGPTTIAASAENSGGHVGSATIVVDALPQSIRDRIAAEGGPSILGPFSFGSLPGGACAYAVYGNAAVAAAGTSTFVVRGAILAKWLAVKDPGGFPKLGCPASDARDVLAGAQAQDFAEGRIYTSGSGTFYVPPVFTAAIDALGGEAGTGVPIADPTSDSRPVFLTWLFQQFAKPGSPLPSTLEIRGDPPLLWVERQAGDGSLFQDAIRPSNPTLVVSFPCDKTASPCYPAPPPDERPFQQAAVFCDNKMFDWQSMLAHVTLGLSPDYRPDPPEWVATNGDYNPTALWGAVRRVELAPGDNPFTHEHVFEPCPTPVLEALVNERICPSDWDLYTRPLPGYRWLATEGIPTVKVEFERVHAQHFTVGWGDPEVGELVFASGRHIVDCGHAGFHTEIHPPFVFARVRTVTYNGKPATQADIWVNAFFPGGPGPIEFDIDPPPRPSPSATLGYSYPNDHGLRVNVTFSNKPWGPVHVKATAPRREPEVDSLGQMKWPKNGIPGGFEGRVLVYWR